MCHTLKIRIQIIVGVPTPNTVDTIESVFNWQLNTSKPIYCSNYLNGPVCISSKIFIERKIINFDCFISKTVSCQRDEKNQSSSWHVSKKWERIVDSSQGERPLGAVSKFVTSFFFLQFS